VSLALESLKKPRLTENRQRSARASVWRVTVKSDLEVPPVILHCFNDHALQVQGGRQQGLFRVFAFFNIPMSVCGLPVQPPCIVTDYVNQGTDLCGALTALSPCGSNLQIAPGP
jgi:hypothetical protein